MAKQLNFGIIGFGFMGQTHAETIKGLDYAHLKAVCDTNESQFEYAPTGVKTYVSANDLLADETVDTVIIAVPNLLHLEMVVKAAKAKKDIICEKPLAMNSEEVKEMMAVTKEEKVRFTVHHQRRWDHDYRVAKEVYDQKLLGNVYTVKSSLYGFNGNMHDWHIYPELGGGMLYDWGVHLIDQILWMIPAKLQTVYADVRNVINENVDDYFNIQLYFDNGVNAQIELGTYFLNSSENWFERHWFVGGDKGSAKIDGFNPKGEITRTSELLGNVPGKITMTHAGPTRSFGPAPEGRILTEELPKVEVSHRMFFDNYYAHTQGTEELTIQSDQILRLMQVVEAIRISAKYHQSIHFE
ncbi:Gfo/Idh/MocA family protein [Candidatus Enterococcus murrayae]|uniref:Gfo/Idh/MocA family oxidoreductase n=1 Tax=Candidatus Enterococcus murrayae TaxID=2815321 RepID=A0ABS3HEY2_9ENTE|nr:Gfo/Idh/MocA family oxidoreductase [Enterococcus sp. MJM16]MBO0451562.1 Gfo/Idh/MocA family oxidoreductase [Enterococcus sp. MJM16]